MTVDITEIIKGVLYLVLAAASAFVIPWVKARVGNENMSEMLTWVDIAVAAAEQLYDSTQGETKKQYVLRFLESKGFRVDEEELNVSIEAAVNRLHAELYGASRDVIQDA